MSLATSPGKSPVRMIQEWEESAGATRSGRNPKGDQNEWDEADDQDQSWTGAEPADSDRRGRPGWLPPGSKGRIPVLLRPRSPVPGAPATRARRLRFRETL